MQLYNLSVLCDFNIVQWYYGIPVSGSCLPSKLFPKSSGDYAAAFLVCGDDVCRRVQHYKYKKVKKGWIVVNCKTGAHSHFRSEYGCYLIINFLLDKVFPKNSYLQESYRRLEDGKEKRQQYFNIQKGVR